MYLIRLGPACNNSCVFCAQHGEPRPDHRELLSRVSHALDSIGQQQHVAFVGGEPTIHEDLPAWVRDATARGVSAVWVQTNGRRFAYLPYAETLAAAGVTHLDVSLHGSTPAMHDYHVSVNGAFVQTCRGIRNARAAGIRVVVSCVWTRSNYRHAVEIVQVARALGAQALRCRFPRPQGRALAWRDRVIPYRELIAPYEKRARAYAQKIALAFDGGMAHDSTSPIAHVDFVADQPEIASNQDVPVPYGSSARVAPGRDELRSKDVLTGEALRHVLPDLFPSEEPENG